MLLYILEGGADSGTRALATLAEFAGVAVRAIRAPCDRLPDEAFYVAATCRSLDSFVSSAESRTWLLRELAASGSSLFLTDVAADEATVRAIQTVVPDVVAEIHHVGPQDVEYRIPTGSSDGLEPFVDLTVGPVDAATTHTFRFVPRAAQVSTLVAVNSGACYVKIQRGETSFLLNGSTTTLDID